MNKSKAKLAKYKFITTFSRSVWRELPAKVYDVFHRRKYMMHFAQKEFYSALDQVADKVCIDLGANVGEYTRLLAKHAKQVIAFEPDPLLLERLGENLSGLTNVQIENTAVGVVTKEVLLYRHKEFEQDPIKLSQANSTQIQMTCPHLDSKNSVKILQIDFLHYLENLQGSIGILKMDIEGAEVELLEALFDRTDLLERIDYIFAETHERLFKESRPRVKKLRERAKLIQRPRINLDWH